MKLNWKKLYQRIRHGRTFDERYEYTVVKCTSLEDIERKHEYMLSTGWIQDGDVIDKYSSVSCWYKRLKDPSVLNETDPMQTSGLDATISWKNSNPKIIEKGNGLNPLIQDEIGQFDPTRAERWKTGPIQTTPDWTEFKAQNPELFDGTANVSSFRIPSYGEDWKLFYGFDPLSSKITTMGEVLNGTLFTEGPDGSVLQYTLRDNIPPNGRYTIYGTVDGRSIIHVTEFTLTTHP